MPFIYDIVKHTNYQTTTTPTHNTKQYILIKNQSKTNQNSNKTKHIHNAHTQAKTQTTMKHN